MAGHIRVLIVDDSPFMRRAVSSFFDGIEDIKVVGMAKDGQEGIRQIEELKPDIVTMDIEMPVMDGLTALKIIMAKHPVPVIMLSSLTGEGAKETLDALDIGAADYIPKNLSNVSLNILKVKDDLIAKIRAITAKKYFFGKTEKPEVEFKSNKIKNAGTSIETSCVRKNGKIDIVAIGSSTGGPKALQDVIPKIPENFPVPIMLVQHMPKAFTGSFAERLSSLSHIKVLEASGGEIIKPGTAYLSPGDKHISLVKEGNEGFKISLSIEPEDLINRPSVSVMMESVAKLYPGKALGVILTGMGSDGLTGMKKIKETGGKTIAQDEATCVVYGMPKAVVDAGIADLILPIYKIADQIIEETVC